MSAVTTTLLQSPPTTTRFPAAPIEQTCHQCGADLSHPHHAVAEDAQNRISELEAQVRILTGKATAAVDKLADYEDELRQLKSSKPPSQEPTSTPRPTSAAGLTHKTPLPSRLSSLLTSTRRTTSQPDLKDPTTIAPTTTPTTTDLLTLLTREQTLRQAAESRAAQTNDEIEELSAQLFSEANEMVASERKARAKLEERVAVLERRDREKRGRLEKLEERLARIERVRGLLRGEGG